MSQKQIKGATGKSSTELNTDMAAISNTTDKDLDQVAGGIDIYSSGRV
jgi:hypothetical protein